MKLLSYTRYERFFFFFKVKEQKKNFFCNSLEKKIFLKFKEKMYIFQ